MEEESKCRCIIWHAVTPDERALVADRIDYARKVGDVQALPLLVAHLSGCPDQSAVSA